MFSRLFVALGSAVTALSSACPPSKVTLNSGLAATPSYQAVRHWFAFGDSYTATGFNPSLGQPSDANPIGNPEYPGNTICGPVPTWVDYMENSIEKPPFLGFLRI